MADDLYEVFTRCLRIYVQGIRRAVRERLQTALGEKWWDLGVWPALSDNQRQSLSGVMERDRRAELVDHLDAGLFTNVVRRNHALAFADAFPVLDVALGLFRRVAHTRNEWAHVPADGLDADTVIAAIEAMTSLLASLRCREALEVNKLAEHESTKSWGSSEPNVVRDTESAYSDSLDEVSEAPLALWHEIQSYLAMDSSVVDAESGRNNQVTVKVQVSNVAPVGEGRPDVFFKDVHLEVRGQGSNRSVQLGQLKAGEAAEREFTFHSKELASVVFEVKGTLDMDRYFRVHRSAGLPVDVVTPILQEIKERLDRIRISDSLDLALDAVRSVSPDMTLADAAKVREVIENARPIIAQKQESLQELFREFHLNKQIGLGAHCHEVWRLLQEAGSRIVAVDSAIGTTNLEVVTEAVRSLEELQIEILQLELMTRSQAIL